MGTNEGASVAEARVGAVMVAVLEGPLVWRHGVQMRDVLDRAMADASVSAVALIGLSSQSDFGAVSGQATDLAGHMASLGKPVVVGLSGACDGPWLALALRATERYCDPSARFRFAQVQIGLCPGSGETQVLPRLIGVAQSLRLLLTGNPVDAAEAVALGLVDRVVEGDLAAETVARAMALGGQAPAGQHEGLRDPVAGQAAIAKARQRLQSAFLPASLRIVDCVEAALLLPLEQGLGFEQVTRDDLADTPEAAGLAYAQRAARHLAALPAEPDWPLPEALSVWGAGGRAEGVIRLALAAGLRVSLCDPDKALLIEALEQIAAWQEAEVAAGRLTPEARDSAWARLTPWLEPVADGPVLICGAAPDWQDAVPEGHLALRFEVGGGDRHPLVTSIAAPGADLAPGGMVELAIAPGAHPGGALSVVHALGLRPVVTGPGGPVVRQMRASLAAAIAHLEGEGVPRPQIAAALAARGLLGGAPAPRASRETAQAQQIVARCEAAMTNAGARLLAQGVVACPLLLDALAVQAGIYPNWAGGPMFQADQRGLLVLRRDLTSWSEEAPAIWSPAPLIGQLVADGQRFADLDPISG